MYTDCNYYPPPNLSLVRGGTGGWIEEETAPGAPTAPALSRGAPELHKFQRQYPTAVARLLDLCQPTEQAQVWALFDLWADKRRKRADETAVETKALARLLHFAPQLALVTVGVYLEERLVAFTINEAVHDGYYIGHFGKADPAYRGLGLYLECATAQIMAQRGCQFMNYEEDWAVQGCGRIKRLCSRLAF